jgi:branched-chain amino acid transport system ATP-binding protein
MLEVKGLSAGYSDVAVLHDVSITVGAGDFVTIVGPNGAGKTTLFKTLSGVLPAMAGSITFDSEDLLAVAAHDRPHRGIAHVPEGRQVFASLTVKENLEMGAYTEAGRAAWNDNIEKIYSWLPVLAEREDQLAGTLSGGEQQMLAMGRALMSRPRLLLMDEPSMGLAPILVEKNFDIIKQVHETGVAVLVVEQNANVSLAIADRGYVLQTGNVVLADRAEALLANDELKKAYLGR